MPSYVAQPAIHPALHPNFITLTITLPHDAPIHTINKAMQAFQCELGYRLIRDDLDFIVPKISRRVGVA